MSSRVCLPPSPSWFGAHLAGWSAGGALFAYAANHLVVVLRPGSRRVVACLGGRARGPGGQQKVTALAFLAQPGAESLLATGAADGTLTLWDVLAGEALHTCRPAAAAVLALATAAGHPGLVYAGDKGGGLWRGSVAAGRAARAGPAGGPGPAIGAAALCDRGRALAAGRDDGSVLLVDTGSGAAVGRLGGHKGDVQSCAWHPDAEGLLLTSSRDRLVRAWRVERGAADPAGPREATLLFTLESPPVPAALAKRSWLTAAWAPRRLWPKGKLLALSSTEKGDLLEWTVAAGAESRFRRVGGRHTRPVFGIGFQPGGELLATFGMDRKVQFSRAGPGSCFGEAHWELDSLGAYPYCVDVNPAVPEVIAAGCGDKTIRVWSSDQAAEKDRLLWEGLRGKVHHVAWHPANPAVLAYATDEGEVGLIDAPKETVSTSARVHRGAVTSLGWCTRPDEEGSPERYLLSAGLDGKVFMYPGDQRWAKGGGGAMRELRVPLASTEGVTCCAWHDGAQVLVTGHARGSVAVSRFADSTWGAVLQEVCAVRHHAKLVLRVACEPLEAPGPLLASCSQDKTVAVYRLEGDADLALVSKDKNRQSASCLAWSPSARGRLAYGVSDRVHTVQVQVGGAGAATERRDVSHTRGIRGVAWDRKADGNLFTAAEDQSVRLTFVL